MLFLVSIAALTFGVLLFMKRELLKGRTQRLEKAIKEFDAVIEAEAPVMEPLPKDVELDMSPCNDDIPETLDFNTFWTTYKYSLELQSEIMVSTSSRNRELMAYFVMDAAGNKHLKGPGTMDNALNDLKDRAEDQYNLMNETREQLTALRKELIATIERHNEKMMDHRRSLIEITRLEGIIRDLKAKIAELENTIAGLEAEIINLKDQIAELERQITELEETLVERDEEIVRLKKLLSERPADADNEVRDWAGIVDPGIKGKVVLVNPEWKFCIFEMTDQLFNEVTGGKTDEEIQRMDLWIKRAGDDEIIVGKIRLLQVKRAEKLATADILTDWQQLPLQAGDLVFFQ